MLQCIENYKYGAHTHKKTFKLIILKQKKKKNCNRLP